MFTDVEAAILSQASYCDYPPKTPYDLCRFLEDNKDDILEGLGDQYEKPFAGLLEKIDSPEYSIVAAENDRRTGFAAYAIQGLGNEVSVICRGTEGDKLVTDTKAAMVDLISDAKLSVDKETFQQMKTEEFVERLEREGYDGYHFYGHSLGGNLAMHGASTLNDKSKLKGVTSYNAPGFNREYLELHEEDIAAIKDKTKNFQNKQDFVSDAMIHPGNVVILEGKSKDIIGLDSHSMGEYVIDPITGTYVVSDVQKKNITALGLVLGGAAALGGAINNTYNTIADDFRRWNGTLIKVPLTTLQEHARTLRSFSDDNGDLFDQIYNSLDVICSNKGWTGVALQMAMEVTKQNKEKYLEFLSELKQLADFLTKFTDAMEQKDKEIKRNIERV